MAQSAPRNEFDAMSDESLVRLAQGGDNGALEYILDRYRSLVSKKASSYFLIGADREDLIQEGMIGLFKAVRDFRSDKLVSFKSFSEVCVTRQIITAIKAATRHKHSPLNTYVSLNKPLFDDEYDATLLDVYEKRDTVSNPEDILISREQINDISVKLSEILSAFECRVLALYLQGRTYAEIGEIVSKTPKSIDNALQRIRRKFEKVAPRLY
ncbi:MAG: RNA polymerase sporulation sigma factor SigH [Clostridia bacterium]|nr:RNA polymerase sporulation sigma factor SigH [Clostridia bacterium]